MSAKHVCTGVVLQCMDWRLRKNLRESLERRFPPEDYDLVSLAGGVKDLLSEEWRTFFFKQFDIARDKHEPSVIALVQHEDCAAYGGSASFEDFEHELQTQRADLQRAKTLLQERYPEARIEGYLIRLSGEMILLVDGEGTPQRGMPIFQKAP